MYLRKTINNKRTFTKPNGDEVVDLTQQNLTPSQVVNIIDYLIVSDDFAMRPDLIAQFFYKDVNATDIVLKQNGISNPFSINENDILFIQERREIDRSFTDIGKLTAREDVRNQYIDPSKAPQLDNNLKRFDERNKPRSSKKKDGPALPPNFSTPGDQEIRLRGGKVIYGEDVSGNRNVANEAPISKSEFLKKFRRNE